ncbi:type IV toxin-antitoxin system AbiEi family antitoxin [Rathayibacter sp. CAU 1779]
MSNAMAAVLGPGVLPLAELCAARLDGELFAIDERFAPVDEPDGVWLRAAALRALVGGRFIAELDSALWVHGLHPSPPPMHTMCVTRADRIKFAPSPRVAVREIAHAPGDLEVIAGLRVTTTSRVLFDLAFMEGRDASAEAMRLLAAHPELMSACLGRVADSPKVPGKTAAMARLIEWKRSVDAAGIGTSGW